MSARFPSPPTEWVKEKKKPVAKKKASVKRSTSLSGVVGSVYGVSVTTPRLRFKTMTINPAYKPIIEKMEADMLKSMMNPPTVFSETINYAINSDGTISAAKEPKKGIASLFSKKGKICTHGVPRSLCKKGCA